LICPELGLSEGEVVGTKAMCLIRVMLRSAARSPPVYTIIPDLHHASRTRPIAIGRPNLRLAGGMSAIAGFDAIP
jgi:hypothetical protein